MTASLRASVAAAGLIVLFHSAASAQTVDSLRGRFEAAVGGQWLAQSALGSRDANLTTSTGAPFRVFSTSTSLTSTGGLEARLGVRLHRRADVEVFGDFAKPTIQTAISNDVENAPATTASETVKQYVVGGAAVWYLPGRYQSPRLKPFLIGSAAYLRQLHDADTLAVTGRLFEAGAGVKYVLVARRARRLPTAGVRADARLQARVHGVEFDDAVHYRPVVSASAFIRF